jgi:tyrosyl-tRNA synthetase
VIITTPLLNSWDGTKMSGSRGNYIALVEPPEEQFGKAMRFPDSMLPELYRLVMESDEDPLAGDPFQAKLRFARFVVARAHGEQAARRAEEHFTRVVRRGEAPAQVPEASLPREDPVHLPALLVSALGVRSTSEARRLIAQGAVRIDGRVVRELDLPRSRLEGAILQAGKRRFARLTGSSRVLP